MLAAFLAFLDFNPLKFLGALDLLFLGLKFLGALVLLFLGLKFLGTLDLLFLADLALVGAFETEGVLLGTELTVGKALGSLVGTLVGT